LMRGHGRSVPAAASAAAEHRRRRPRSWLAASTAGRDPHPRERGRRLISRRGRRSRADARTGRCGRLVRRWRRRRCAAPERWRQSSSTGAADNTAHRSRAGGRDRRRTADAAAKRGGRQRWRTATSAATAAIHVVKSCERVGRLVLLDGGLLLLLRKTKTGRCGESVRGRWTVLLLLRVRNPGRERRRLLLLHVWLLWHTMHLLLLLLRERSRRRYASSTRSRRRTAATSTSRGRNVRGREPSLLPGERTPPPCSGLVWLGDDGRSGWERQLRLPRIALEGVLRHVRKSRHRGY